MMRRVFVAFMAFLITIVGMASVSEACFLRRGRCHRRSCRNQCYSTCQTHSKGGKELYGNGAGEGDGTGSSEQVWTPRDESDRQLGAPSQGPKAVPKVPDYLVADRS